jgi:hypothetical protein
MSDRDIEFPQVRGSAEAGDPFGASRPDPSSVERLLTAARAHPLGIDYLMKGYLGSVAATFGVHAFTVEEARRQARANAKGTNGEGDGLS